MSSTVFTSAQPRSLKEEAYERIKRLIITMRLRPGELLNLVQLSSSLDIGRTPVLQAVEKLVFDGLVDVIPRKGIVVRPVTLDEVLDLIEVRTVNEAQCARLAALRAEDADIQALEKIAHEADEATQSGSVDIERQMYYDQEFHRALAKASKNPVLAELMHALHERSLRFWFISLRTEQHHVAVGKEHRMIIKALRKRDPEAAAKAIVSHIESFKRNITRSI